MSSMFAQVVASVRSISSRLWQRWSVLDRRVRIGAAGVAALAVAGAVTGVVLLMSGGGGPRCDKPLCIEVLGPGGEDVSTMAPVRIRLAGSLDRHIALSALKISNEPAGRREFVGDVLTFRPEWPGFARGTDVRRQPEALGHRGPARRRSRRSGLPLQTQGKLQVASVFPQDGSQEVALDGAIMVQFNRSVAPLTVIAKRGPDAIVTFDPPIAGRGRWLNTSLYTFTPAGTGWAPSTRYTARVKAGLANELGSTLDADYVFSFTTLLPKAVDVLPARQQQVRRALARDQGRLQPAGRPRIGGGRVRRRGAGVARAGRRRHRMDGRPHARLPARASAGARHGVRGCGARRRQDARRRRRDRRRGALDVQHRRRAAHRVGTTPENGATAADRGGVTLTLQQPDGREVGRSRTSPSTRSRRTTRT